MTDEILVIHFLNGELAVYKDIQTLVVFGRMLMFVSAGEMVCVPLGKVTSFKVEKPYKYKGTPLEEKKNKC